jgi:hypothetical protein
METVGQGDPFHLLHGRGLSLRPCCQIFRLRRLRHAVSKAGGPPRYALSLIAVRNYLR